ncbi:lipoyl(octanoyl) transferase LipB [Legionella longbeachae]|uniref:Octanoyltransferase n=1 Tax=Legionella longbeachae serogroup 1 (strain NSW150) TaxID=661367 RepID=D3HTA3_LEGLN|nr:lipoyl(octanoyl) transferase LipB [Legionella longbeachae]VEE02636.1 Legionella secretion system protein X [Legionella oakridgensis]HBD7397899.1 lipoyl(octanoyl) transferase LipB [Legionella pneumophila]ARB91097.1 lipoyl(octanoyl) transferase LipB [Legionella longbeachae]ARM32475.1 lipoyl(octanoyl) transferase LipB [Legionella longbeachae]EEZ94713.1 Legionella secretion system protein X [Legionella longbeachae D-4968]
MKIRQLGIQNYNNVWLQMKDFTQKRQTNTEDELWLLEHFSVYTQGQAGKPEHILNPANIPVIQSDRGGQVTYHGPGQLVAYVLMDLKSKNLGIRSLVSKLEQILICVLEQYKIEGSIRCGAPGVYVKEQKIASIGLRVKNGCTYHGIALNVNMDLKPFSGINPCGFEKMEMTQISHFYPTVQLDEVNQQFVQYFLQQFYP